MAIGSIYSKYFKYNSFLKINLLFSFITIVTIITFSYLMYQSFSQAAVRRDLDNQTQAMETIDRYISGKNNSVKSMMADIYRSNTLSADLSYFLQHPYNEYVKNQLDHYDKNVGELNNSLIYFRNQLETDGYIRNIVLYSPDMQTLYALDENKQLKVVSVNSAHSYIPDAMAMDAKNVTAPNFWVRKTIGQYNPRLYAVQVPINDKQTLKNVGQLLVYFDASNISDAISVYTKNLKGDILVKDASGIVIFDSTGRHYGEKTPNDAAVFNGERLVNGIYVNMLSSSEGGYTVIGEVPRSDIAVSFRTMRNTIVIISLICIMVAILIPSLFIRSFARRTKNIIVFMRKVKNGDFNARIHDFREDELGQISKSFNSMLDELNEYIDRVYKAEINQKQTELAALQARVNPHFLYNTLEVIRMRAFSQGANDAAEMIYSLSVLFKSLVLRQENYTLNNELEACQQYLELFRIRYKNKFSYEIVCPPELRSVKVMKLSLQPIIENYIVHGIRSDRNDNLLTIRITQESGNILAIIEDNGKGIEAEALVGIRQRLEDTDESDGSFGIRSVQARLNLLYGKPYGMELESIPEVGTKVTILFPDTRERVEKFA